MIQTLEMACTHTHIRTAGPFVIDRAAKLLLPPYPLISVGVRMGIHGPGQYDILIT
jgi:hypothetical protein